MQFMLSIYERPGTALRPNGRADAGSYPKQLTIDYFRAYQPLGGFSLP